MPALEAHTGLLRTTIPFFNRRKFVDLSAKYTWYTIFPMLKGMMNRAIASKWQDRNYGIPSEVTGVGGTSFKFNVQVASNNDFTWVSDDDPVPIQRKDFQVQGELPWRLVRMMTTSYTDWELSANTGAEKIVDLVEQRTLGNEQGAADGAEAWGWGAPPASTDDKTAFPLRYYLYTEPESVTGSYSANATIGTGANGNRLAVNHASYTSGPAGISRLAYPRTAPFNCQYTGFSATGAATPTELWWVYTIACMETDWAAPVDSPALAPQTPDKCVYTTRNNIITKSINARGQNDMNTSDLNARMTDSEFYKIPWVRVPYFDTPDFSLYSSSNKNVVYGVDHTKFHWATRTGFNMEDEIFGHTREAPKTTTHVRFLGGQLVCLDASTSFVLSD